MSSSGSLLTRLSEKLQIHMLAVFLPCFGAQVLLGLFLASLESVLPLAPTAVALGRIDFTCEQSHLRGFQFPVLFSLPLFLTVTSYHLKGREDQDSILETSVASCSPAPTLSLPQACKSCRVCSHLLDLYSNKDGPATGIPSAMRESAWILVSLLNLH